MAIIDNSNNNMSTKEIKDVLINTFKRSAEKSVHEASYDKTILATIQSCIDKTTGQYKIKYQNGYFTAYARDKETAYSNKASVYVLVPGNNMENKMFITGLATDDSSQLISLSQLEGDQQYMIEDKNFILDYSSLDMCSYDGGGTKRFHQDLYRYGNTGTNRINILNDNPQYEGADLINAIIKNGGGFLRIGASFKTSLDENQKQSQGNYGLIVRIKYDNIKENNGCKTYVLDTFSMKGVPFNFTSYVPQYRYFEIDKEHFVRIESIEEFCEGFNAGNISDKDIFIKDFSIYSAYKVYDNVNDSFRVAIDTTKTGAIFPLGNTSDNFKLQFSAKLTKMGDEVTSQDVEYYWLKEDVSVNSVNHKKYCKYAGKGWYCLNKSYVKSSEDATTAQDIKNANYVYDNDDTSVFNVNGELTWVTNQKEIFLGRSLFPGREARVKCIAIYQNAQYESSTITVLNPNGMFVSIDNPQGQNSFINGQGSTTLTAGVFSVDINDNIISKTLDSSISYRWTVIDEFGNEIALPNTDANSILIHAEGWDSQYDNEKLDNDTVNQYLNNHPEYVLCYDRYVYYNNVANKPADDSYFSGDPNPPQWRERAIARRDYIINTQLSNIDKKYAENDTNEPGYYILGPSQTTGEYTDDLRNNIKIKEITHYYYSDDQYSDYQRYKTKQNTLYNLRASTINGYASYKVTALQTINGLSQAVGTITVNLRNEQGSALEYDLIIQPSTSEVYVYDEAGRAPDNQDYNHETITIHPLSFVLQDKGGGTIFDSSDSSAEDYAATLTALHPVWSFFRKECSLIQTKYEGTRNYSIDSNNSNKCKLEYEPFFYYYLKKEFDYDLRDNSNISLQVTYNDKTVVAITHFTFQKQGDLGTNGTSQSISIKDSNYTNGHLDNVLSDQIWSKFSDPVKGEQYFQPGARHLGNTYLYATKCYDSNKTISNDILTASYVNLKFVNSSIQVEDYDGGVGITGTDHITLRGFWNNESNDPLSPSAEWKAESYRSDKQNNNFYNVPPFTVKSQIQNTDEDVLVDNDYVGRPVMVTLTPSAQVNDNQNGDLIYYKPSPVDNYVREGKTYTRIGQNMIVVKDSHVIPEFTDTVTGVEMTSDCYGYYGIPYFYFAYYVNNNNNTDQYLDPARHIVITGGYDQVLYDETGHNPAYSNTPFKFYLFDKDNKDITQDVLKTKSNATGHTGRFADIRWSCSNGLQMNFENNNNTVMQYTDYGVSPYNDMSLMGHYCIYEGQTYKCIVDHIYNYGTIVVNGVTYSNNAFIRPYWERVNFYSGANQSCSLKPAPVYDSTSNSSLFNSWIHLYVKYVAADNYTYEAEAFLPINVICNPYGSSILNGWDGKKTKIDDAYILSSAVAAGVKTTDNKFVGINIGTTIFENQSEKHPEIGLFGYGHYNEGAGLGNERAHGRTIFMDANTGRTILGPSGSAQIVLNPAERSWSRLAGWYFHPDYLYKPVFENDLPDTFDSYAQGGKIIPPTTQDGSVGMYVPMDGTVTASDVFLWASARNKDLDLSEITDELTTMQTNLATTYGITFGPGLYGDITNQDVKQAEVQHQIDNLGIVIQIIGFNIDHNYGLVIDSTTLTDPWEDYDKKYYEAPILNNLPANLYNPFTGTYTIYDPEYDMFVAQTVYIDFISDIADDLSYEPQYEGWSWKKIGREMNKTYNVNRDNFINTRDNLIEDCNNYTTLLKRYRDLLESESQAKVVDYNDFNTKKGNFYVTYGGKLHAASAEIEGKITATSGSFGNSSNKILISTIKNGKSYILYNKNFWVRDGSAGDPEIYMKGTIKAKSGQIGRITNNTDGDSSNTLFIQYTWYPWHLPEDNEPWSELKEEINAGKTEKYALYNKNFFIRNNGEALFNGYVYSKRGRIGDWVITQTDLKDITSNIVLHPASTASSSASSSRIKIGKNNNNYNLEIIGDGSMHGPRKPGDAQPRPYYWSISSTGQAYFDHPENIVRAQTIYLGSGTGGSASILDASGLNFPTGSKIYLGDSHIDVGTTGFTFTGGVGFQNKVNFSKGLELTGGSSIISGALKINNSIIKMGDTYMTTSDFFGEVRNTTINGTNIAQYISDKIDEKFARCVKYITTSYSTVAGETVVTGVKASY